MEGKKEKKGKEKKPEKKKPRQESNLYFSQQEKGGVEIIRMRL